MSANSVSAASMSAARNRTAMDLPLRRNWFLRSSPLLGAGGDAGAGGMVGWFIAYLAFVITLPR